MGEGHYPGGAPEANQRLTVREASGALGISEAAVRNRIKRGTLRSEKVSGRVYVVLAGAANHDASSGEPTGESQLVAVLREQLAAEREANREMRRLLAGLIERMPALEAPPEPQNQAQSAESRSDRVETSEESREAQKPAERPWWRRLFGR